MNKILEKIFKGYAVLEEVESPINGKIQVREDLFGKKRLVVGGLTQSGEPVEKIWTKAINHLPSTINHCLILGLGAGSVVQLIKAHWPKTKILGIEIDQEVIRLGKKYFGLGEIKNLKIEIGDATKIINHKPSIINHHDLILVDLYIGSKLPKEVKSEKFLRNTKKLLSENGVAIFNWLKNGDERQLVKKLKTIFSQVEALDLKTNLFLSCRP